MDQLIKFRHFTDSISQNEFESLMPAISKIIGKNVLVSLLYDHLHSDLNKSEYNATVKLEQINHEIATIVNHNTPLTQPKLNKICQPLINNICSYLDLKSYTIFARCNRTIFIASKSPVQIYHVNHMDITHYLKYCHFNKLFFNENIFYRVKSLKLDHFPWSLPDLWEKLIFDDLQNLSINLYSSFKVKSIQNITLTKLTKLTLEMSANDESINNILRKPSNLQFLDLYYYHPPTIYPNSQNIIRNLSGLSLQVAARYDQSRDVSLLISLENDILNACGSELTSFHTGSELIYLNVNHIRFPNLTELCLRNNYNPNVMSVISKFKYLQRLRFNLSEFNIVNDRIELNTKFVNGLLSLNKLESIDFGYISQERIPMLFKLIQNGLMMHKKNKLKISMICLAESADSDIHIDLEIFVNSLEFFICDFMFIFSVRYTLLQSQRENIEQWLNSLDEERFWWIYGSLSGDGYFIVANKGCKINTCQREWIMQCVCCEDWSNL